MPPHITQLFSEVCPTMMSLLSSGSASFCAVMAAATTIKKIELRRNNNVTQIGLHQINTLLAYNHALVTQKWIWRQCHLQQPPLVFLKAKKKEKKKPEKKTIRNHIGCGKATAYVQPANWQG